MCECTCRSDVSSRPSTPKADKVSQFIRGNSRFTWRSLPEIAAGTYLSVGDVLNGLKEDVSRFNVRFGTKGDVYVAVNR